jgi:hypothetical protein
MKKIFIVLMALLVLLVVFYSLNRKIEFPLDAQIDFDMRLKSLAGRDFNYDIVSLRNTSNFNPEGLWCIQIEPAIQEVDTSSNVAQEFNHFSMLKEGKLWVMVQYNDTTKDNWIRSGCGDWYLHLTHFSPNAATDLS